MGNFGRVRCIQVLVKLGAGFLEIIGTHTSALPSCSICRAGGALPTASLEWLEFWRKMQRGWMALTSAWQCRQHTNLWHSCPPSPHTHHTLV